MNTVAERLVKLRNLMKQKNIDAWIAPSADSHQSEYVAEHWKCRQWISGFTGSAGTVVITMENAGLWTDSRYFLQAEKELDGSGIKLFKLGMEGVPDYTEWLRENLENQAVVGFDGSLLSVAEVNSLLDKLSEKQISLSYNDDLIDKIWSDRPPIPQNPVSIMPEEIAGESTTSKILRIRENLLAKGATCHLVGTLDDIAWTFNIRGTDISYNPVVISYTFINMETAILFIDKTKLTDSVMEKFRAEDVEIRDYSDIFTFLRKLDEKNKILIDNNKISQKLRDAIPDGCEIFEDMNISAELKTVKNSIELKGFINAHLRDGAAMVKWLYWLEKHLGKIAMDEVSVAEKLEDIRSRMNHYKGLSFSTIVGYKENGAIVHYTAKKETAAKIQPEGLLLVDSGAQYEDGTTDITRTISLGGTTAEEKDAFTTVLKGHINLARAIFPKGYTGAKIDTFARGPIWEKLYNYGHGTGHGIGHYLNVHEGPQQIRPTNHYEIKAGMVNSNEPGMYLEGKFGIRIENLIVAREKESNEYGTFLTFDTITLCPIDLSLIDQKRLNDDEKTWLNEYHEKVRNELQPLLADEENEWLMKKTEAI